MQKLVTVALRRESYQIPHGMVEEHLADLLRDGWKVLSVTPVGSTGGGGDTSHTYTAGWIAVVLEKA